VLVPVLVFVWDLDWDFSPITCAILFIVAAWTDWLDGYLARKLRISTVFGAFLDPVADKIMVKLGLTCAHTLHVWPGGVGSSHTDHECTSCGLFQTKNVS